MAASCEDASRIRLELKQWEQTFAATHGGRKVERADIKQHPEIGSKLLTHHLLTPEILKFNDQRKGTSVTTSCGHSLPKPTRLSARLRRKSAMPPPRTLQRLPSVPALQSAPGLPPSLKPVPRVPKMFPKMPTPFAQPFWIPVTPNSQSYNHPPHIAPALDLPHKRTDRSSEYSMPYLQHRPI